MTCSFARMKQRSELATDSAPIRPIVRGIRIAAGLLLAGAAAGFALPRFSETISAREGVASDTVLLQRMLDAEDARAIDSTAIVPLVQGLQAPDAETRRVAVRALGRIEWRQHLDLVEPLLSDPSAAVRTEALNALAQIAKGDAAAVAARAAVGDLDSRLSAWTSVQSVVLDLATRERKPAVRGAIARALGRLPYSTEEAARQMAEPVVGMLDGVPTDGTLGREPWFGVVHGVDALLRRFPNLRTAPAIIRVASLSLPRAPSAATAGGRSDTLWSREINVILAAIRGRVLGAAVGSPNGLDE